MKQKLWTAVPVAAWILQLGAELFTVYSILKLNMLPMNWMAAVVFLGLAALAGLTAALVFLPKKASCRVSFCQILAIVFALAITGGCTAASSALFKLSNTVSAITGNNRIAEVIVPVGVYTLADHPAESLSDLADDTFAVNKADSDAYLPQALSYIESETGKSIQISPYEGITDMVDALYEQDVQAIIINDAFADVLTELEGYTDFSTRTKEIARISVIWDNAASLIQDASDSTTTVIPSEKADDSDQIEVPEVTPDVTNTPFLVYLSGSDTRDQMLTTSRSDVNILAVVNPNTKQILLINTPRDYYVGNPAGGGAKDKLTHCGIYGIDCSMEALAGLYQEEIDYYAQINFTGFETLIDAIGGVTVYSDIAFKAVKTEIHVGNNDLDGHGALDFARERKSLSGGDNDRGKHQMEVLRAVLQKMSAGTILKYYSGIMDSLAGMFITNISSAEVSDLVKMQLSDIASWDVFTYAVTGTGGRNVTYSMPGQSLYVMYPNEESVAHATELIDRIMVGELLSEADME